MKWIIDGNNFIHADSELRQKMNESGLPAAVQWLCHELKKATVRGGEFVLCLDPGADAMSLGPPSSGLEVCVAEHGSTADDLILLLIQHEDSNQRVEIVTNDFKDIGKRLPGGRVQHCTCADFRQRALASKNARKKETRQGPTGGKPAAPRSRKQIDFWLDQFSEEEGS